MRRSESEIARLLRQRYDPKEWIFLTGVRNATGYSSSRIRTADAIAINMWPSRGLSFQGFEIKSSRADWQKELDQPEKAEEISRFMDHWWIVTGDTTIVRESEIPPTWGLIAITDKDVPKVIRQAPQLPEPQQMTKGFMVSLMKEVATQASMEAEVSRQVAAEMERRLPELRKQAELNSHHNALSLVHELDAIRKELAELKDAMGYDLIKGQLYGLTPLKIGNAVRAYLEQEIVEARLTQNLNNLHHLVREADAFCTKMLGKLQHVDVGTKEEE